MAVLAAGFTSDSTWKLSRHLFTQTMGPYWRHCRVSTTPGGMCSRFMCDHERG